MVCVRERERKKRRDEMYGAPIYYYIVCYRKKNKNKGKDGCFFMAKKISYLQAESNRKKDEVQFVHKRAEVLEFEWQINNSVKPLSPCIRLNFSLATSDTIYLPSANNYHML